MSLKPLLPKTVYGLAALILAVSYSCKDDYEIRKIPPTEESETEETLQEKKSSSLQKPRDFVRCDNSPVYADVHHSPGLEKIVCKEGEGGGGIGGTLYIYSHEKKLLLKKELYIWSFAPCNLLDDPLKEIFVQKCLGGMEAYKFFDDEFNKILGCYFRDGIDVDEIEFVPAGKYYKIQDKKEPNTLYYNPNQKEYL